MEHYYINENKCSKGSNEVHRLGCHFLNIAQNTADLGFHMNAKDAVNSAKTRGYTSADGCLHCCPKAHTDK